MKNKAKPGPGKFRLSRITLRPLATTQLIRPAGGLVRVTDVGCWPRSNAWTAAGDVLCGG